MSLILSPSTDLPHRFGTFWITDRGKWSISRSAIKQVASDLGFCLFRGSSYRITGKFVVEVTERDIQDVLLSYIEDTGQIAFVDIINAYEAFMHRNGKYTISRLPILDREHFLNDTETTCYKFFSNIFIQITPTDINYHAYDQLPQDKFVLFSKVQRRDFAFNEHGRYLDFLKKSTDWSIHQTNIQTIIGYLSHEYKDETTGYIVVLTEQCPDPKDGGGSGKNLFCNLLSNTTTYHSKNGAQAKFDEKFFQSWSGQRIMAISDAPKNFPFEFLKEPSTGTFILKKLFKDEIEIPVPDGPKFIVQTNYSYELSDGGLKRRIMPLEFTDFFTKIGGVDVHYGLHFPKGWSIEDWNNFDTIIVQCVQTWLKANRKIKPMTLTETGWRKQFEYSHGRNLTTFIEEKFEDWLEARKVLSRTISDSLKSFYAENDIDRKYHYSAAKVAQAIKEWCAHQGVYYEPNRQEKDLGINNRYHIFSKNRPE